MILALWSTAFLNLSFDSANQFNHLSKIGGRKYVTAPKVVFSLSQSGDVRRQVEWGPSYQRKISESCLVAKLDSCGVSCLMRN